ncbi:hypothetical protein D3C87_323600 [compost metagenome]
MSLEKGIKVVTIVDLSGLPKGSIIQGCVERTLAGIKHWEGVFVNMSCSWNEIVKQSDCEIWDEEKHDPVMFVIKKHFEEKARQDRLSPVLSHMCNQLIKE